MKISMQEPVQTRDAAWLDEDQTVNRIMSGIKNSLGVLDPDDVEIIESILQRYDASSGMRVNGLGATVTDTAAADAGRRAGAHVRAEIAHNQSIADRYRKFWDERNAELRESIRR